jgi:hypothetical protein
MADHDAQAAATPALPPEYQKCLEELKDLLEHLKANDLSEDTMALLLSHLNLDLPDDVSNEIELEPKGLSTRKD